MADLPPGLAEAWQALEVAFPEQPSLAEIPAACHAGRLALSTAQGFPENSGRLQIGKMRAAGCKDLEEQLDTDGMTAEIL